MNLFPTFSVFESFLLVSWTGKKDVSCERSLAWVENDMQVYSVVYSQDIMFQDKTSVEPETGRSVYYASCVDSTSSVIKNQTVMIDLLLNEIIIVQSF